LFQFPPQYAAISEQHQPAELIPMFSTIEYTITVSTTLIDCLQVYVTLESPVSIRHNSLLPSILFCLWFCGLG